MIVYPVSRTLQIISFYYNLFKNFEIFLAQKISLNVAEKNKIF